MVAGTCEICGDRVKPGKRTCPKPSCVSEIGRRLGGTGRGNKSVVQEPTLEADRTIGAARISTRARNCLLNLGLLPSSTADDVAGAFRLTKPQFIRGYGPTTHREVVDWLSRNGVVTATRLRAVDLLRRFFTSDNPEQLRAEALDIIAAVDRQRADRWSE